MVVAVILAVNISRRKEGSSVEVVIPKLAGQMGLTLLDPKGPYHPDRSASTGELPSAWMFK
jgi:hypothetical protein